MDFTSVCYSGDSVMYVGTSSGKLFFLCRHNGIVLVIISGSALFLFLIFCSLLV